MAAFFTLFAEAGSIQRGAVNEVLTGTLQGAVLPIGGALTGTLTVYTLQEEVNE